MTADSKQLKTISEIALQINASLNISSVMDLIYQNISKEMSISFFFISSYSESEDTIKIEYCVKNGQVVQEEFNTKSNNPNSLTAFTIKSKEEVIISDLSLDYPKYLSGKPQLHGKEDLWCESVLMFPLIIQNKIIGLFSVQSENKYSYTIENVALLRLLGPFIGIALNNANLFSSLSAKNKIIEEKNKDITDSIRYAKHLQNGILPSQDFINDHIPNNFVLYKPKDIVAGDFYFSEQVDNFLFVAVADCTGHGVPGAMVSVVCCNALTRSVKEFKVTDTGQILDKTRELVIETFAKSNSGIADGMDISLLCIDKQNKMVFWSGANNPLWYIQGNDFKQIKANKQPIGKCDNQVPFTTHQIEYTDNTIFYLFTDELADQFGGPNGKKFKYKQFAELLSSIHDRPLQEQADTINRTFETWKTSLDQVDDICVVGLKL